jgi:CRP-like cAMP-binding protein
MCRPVELCSTRAMRVISCSESWRARSNCKRTGRIIATFGPDDVFGEMALIDKAPRMATAMAITDNVLATIDEHIFLFLVHETPRFALSVMSVMSDRLRDHASNQTEVEPRPTSS